VNHRPARLSRADLPFVVCAVASGVFVLYLGRSLTFWFDEWRSITFDGGFVDYFRPINEHWSTLPLLLYRATFNVVELHSYLPYLAEVIVLHLVAVAGAYVLMRRRVGRMGATVLALPLLLLGAGAENLFWAFQTGFVGSVALGVWALVLVERPRVRDAKYASAFLVLSVMSSGVGLFFVAALAVRTAVDAGRRPRLWAVAPPALVYAAWHLTLGQDAVGDEEPLAGPGSVFRFSVRGISHAIEALLGMSRFPTGGVLGVAGFVLVCALIARSSRRGRWPALACGCVGGLVAMYVLIGVARAGFDFDFTTRSRYVYVASFFLVLCCADLIARPMVVSLRGRRAIGAAGVTVLLAWVVAANVNSLVATRNQFQYDAHRTRALIQLAVKHEGEPWVDPDASFLLTPPASELPPLTERYGSPVEDSLVPRLVMPPPERAYESAALLLSGKHFRTESASGDFSVTPPRVTDVVGAVIRRDSTGCASLRPVREYGFVTFAARPGARLRLTSRTTVDAKVWLGYDLTPSRGLDVVVGPGRAQDVLTPDRVSRPSRVAVTLLETSDRIRVCGLRQSAKRTSGAGLPSSSP